nr:immunoglobulin light chain junction region [Mus musculus]NSL98088.1 immunoglobulin light chain junction region [Mus musculus]NSL98796.1 immunoglobulin light chain junction region [Mus musculus]NSM00694.1 immunoglobulin light chain junction region [Mus musculus]NSM01290.1 immunoglobulin light chain junction region [Mus musculus]
CQQHYRTPRTF